MIGYIKGEVSHLFAEYCFINVAGVGYRLYIPESTRKKLQVGQTSLLYTYLNVREDAMLLFGFVSQEEYDLFIKLIAVTGIGPKVALTVLSTMSVEEFCLAVMQKNITLITRIPGIGKKTAERLVLELKDKLGMVQRSTDEETSGLTGTHAADITQEAIGALVALGYSQAEVMPVVRKAGKEHASVEAIVKAVLREFVRGI